MTTILANEGTLFSKDYSNKLEFALNTAYKEKVFEFRVFELQSWQGIKRSYKKNIAPPNFMNEEQFIKYLYAEGYLDMY